MPTVDIHSTYGALLVGLLFATFFQGVLSVQLYIYYETFPKDPRKIKALVASVWCIDMLHLVLISQTAYHYLVSNWGNAFVLPFSTWELALHLVLLGLVTIACQFFFLHRIYIFSDKSKLLIAFLATLCLATFGLDTSMSIQNIQHTSVQEVRVLKPEVIAVFSLGAGSDVLIAILLCYYLQRGRSGFPKTNSVITRLIEYTVSTSLVTSLLAVGCLIAYFASPDSLIFVAMHFSLGRMYTNALLATLNSRQRLRDKLYAEPQSLELPASFNIGRFQTSTSPLFAENSKKGDSTSVSTRCPASRRTTSEKSVTRC